MIKDNNPLLDVNSDPIPIGPNANKKDTSLVFSLMFCSFVVITLTAIFLGCIYRCFFYTSEENINVDNISLLKNNDIQVSSIYEHHYNLNSEVLIPSSHDTTHVSTKINEASELTSLEQNTISELSKENDFISSLDSNVSIETDYLKWIEEPDFVVQ